MNRNSIANTDCLQFLRTLPDKSVDLVLTDRADLVRVQGNEKG